MGRGTWDVGRGPHCGLVIVCHPAVVPIMLCLLHSLTLPSSSSIENSPDEVLVIVLGLTEYTNVHTPTHIGVLEILSKYCIYGDVR